MKITLRLIVSLMSVITLVVAVFTYFQVRHEKKVMLEEIEKRSAVVAESLQESIEPVLSDSKQKMLARLVEKFGNRERLVGVAVYDSQAKPIAMTKSLSEWLPDPPPEIQDVISSRKVKTRFRANPQGHDIHGYFFPLQSSDNSAFVLALFHNADHIRDRSRIIWQVGFARWLIQAFLLCMVTVFVIRWNIMSPLHRAADWIKGLRLGTHSGSSVPLPKGIFGPLAKEVTHIASSLNTARAAAEEEARLRQTAESLWTPERLKEFVKTKLEGKPLFVVSNREPFMHVRRGKEIESIVPASGLVTGLEPIIRACGGTWIAHGGGDADRQTVDSNDRLRVPPDEPQYTVRRVWLSKEEEDGYYYGFSNEGLWPLCHIAHNRPMFIPEDWNYYQSVNRKFADAVIEEMEGTDEPCVLVQDYHFALLPQLIKEKRPDARVALFWHIPWPNPESFGICPWGKELLYGMLGADLMGFHTQFHCNNFLDTVDRVIESRVDRERFTVNRQGHTTWVKPFPISVAFPQGSNGKEKREYPSKELLLKDLGVKAEFMGVGVDRIDYTKGIVERFRSVERFLETNKSFHERFTFVELGAPSRTLIERYHDLIGQVEAEAERINWKFKTKEWTPIVFLKKHHSHGDIEPFYRAADLCLVTSLHDGMNLVAKEYVASRDTEDGVLILSRFTGASRELRDALIINPYDIEQTADAIRLALTMEPAERMARMKSMRQEVKENNVYRWGAGLITELVRIRPYKRETAAADAPLI